MAALRILLACLLVAAGLAGTEILRLPGLPGMGIPTVPIAEQTWRSHVMTWPGKVADRHRVQAGPDFFVSEYGETCSFARDWVRDFGYCRDGSYSLVDGAMVFTTGASGFTFGFGGIAGDLDRPSARLGAAWGPCRKDLYRLRLELEQDVPETAWEFTVSRFKERGGEPLRFAVRGQGSQVCEVDAGLVRELGAATGFRLRCATPGATVRLRSIRLAPSSAYVYFRRRFTLPDQPMQAQVSFLSSSLEAYDLHVNGRPVDSGSRIYPSGKLRHVDLTRHLTAGENVIAIRRQFVMWSSNVPDLLIEGVAVDRAGTITRLVADDGWRCAVDGTDAWSEPGFDDTAWAAPRLSPYATALADGTPVATGLEPRHMGLLDAAPEGRPYPVFGPGEAPSFRVRLPAGVHGRLRPWLEIRPAGGGPVIEALGPGEVVLGDDLAVYPFRPALRTVGPYRLDWSLRDPAGQQVESRRDELVVVGPIAQETLPLASFESALAGRLTLVQRIDCTAQPPADGFVDHAGMYNPPKTGKGRVAGGDGLAWRETGPGCWDYFAYRLDLPESARGLPHLIEVEVPDDRTRYVLSCVVETFPIPFSNNPGPLGSRGWIGSSGACLTGGRWYPLSHGIRRLRYIHHPGSLNAAVAVMSGLYDGPAAACAISVYRIEGGLPALEVPASGRLFGSHNERISVTALSTASENPLELDPGVRRSGHRDAWANWYRAIERKIRWLRFQGHNMAVEGVFMYDNGDVPSLRHNTHTSNQDFDLPLLMLRMYASNGIRCQLGFEYCNSPDMEASGEGTVSDRRMWQGTPGVHAVDRHGRQLVGTFSTDGINFLDPSAERRMLDALGEIRERYRGVGGVAGLFLVTGDWWAPGFVHGNYRDLETTEVGYDDLTCGLFERDTGIDLGQEPSDPQRFRKRYDRLMGIHRTRWLEWRGLKLRAAIERIRERVGTGADPWEVYLYPSTSTWRQSPFLDRASTRTARDATLESYLDAQGLPLGLYADQPGLRLVTPLHEVDFFAGHRSTDDTLPWHGWNTNPGTRAVLRRLDTLYMSTSLLEADLPAGAAPRWLWNHTARGVFVLRGAEDNAMHHFVTAMRDHTPRTMYYSWIDCNLETGFGAQQRRFAKAFYATPEADFAPLAPGRAIGVTAQAAPRPGGCWLRLVNASPYPLTGHVRGGAVRDLVYDRDVPAAADGCPLELAPNDIRILAIDTPPDQVACRFALPEAVAATLRDHADSILADPGLGGALPGDLRRALEDARRQDDSHALHGILNDFEVASVQHRVKAEAAALVWQRKLIEDLAAGAARIDCAGTVETRDRKGRRWLPDQAWLGGGAYGSTGASFADRGSLSISGTDAERVCQTEAYGSLVTYRIPVPDGTYNVHLHLAETYAAIQRAGVRLFSVRVKSHRWERQIDPFAEAGGFARAVVLSETGVAVTDGMIDIEMAGGVGIQGIEIEALP